MAGRGFRVKELRESIMQWERFSARRAVRFEPVSSVANIGAGIDSARLRENTFMQSVKSLAT